ncbi:MAG TPA: hypothetical protein VK990_02170 [Acidimicrobiia bacterium]|nr:hypothetical protein [Acidimicrobiia bacterium]
MKRRFFGTLGLAVAWSAVALAGVTLGWVLLGAALIGILGTIGLEPPRRRRVVAVELSYV